MRAIWLRMAVITVVLLLFPLSAWAQVTLPCTRIDTNGVVANVGVDVCAGGAEDGDWPGANSGETLAYQSASASASDGGAIATASGQGSASCVANWNATANVPQVDTTADVSANALSSEECAMIAAQGSGIAATKWRVEKNGSETTGNLNGSMYLVATGGDTGVGELTGAVVKAQCGDSWVTAGYGEAAQPMQQAWTIFGVLQDGANDPIEINEYSASGINNLYLSTQPTKEGDFQQLNASSSWDMFFEACDEQTGSSLRGFSASAWFEVESN